MPRSFRPHPVALPAEIQTYTTNTLGIVAGSKQVDAAKALIAFLTSPAAKQALAAKGFEPQ
jgi:molybdate transport system substrate-binding protein